VLLAVWWYQLPHTHTHAVIQCVWEDAAHVYKVMEVMSTNVYAGLSPFNPLAPELNPSAQRCLTRFFAGDFASWTVRFVNICVKNQQIHQLFIQFINYVW
jgi:hypothetical protein